jgi:hypothetical protein
MTPTGPRAHDRRSLCSTLVSVGVVLASGLAAGCLGPGGPEPTANATFERITVQQIELVNAAGRTVGTLGTDGGGNAELSLANGNSRITFSAMADGPRVRLYDADNKLRMKTSVTGEATEVRVFDPTGRPRGALGCTQAQPYIILNDADGLPMVSIP